MLPSRPHCPGVPGHPGHGKAGTGSDLGSSEYCREEKAGQKPSELDVPTRSASSPADAAEGGRHDVTRK